MRREGSGILWMLIGLVDRVMYAERGRTYWGSVSAQGAAAGIFF